MTSCYNTPRQPNKMNSSGQKSVLASRDHNRQDQRNQQKINTIQSPSSGGGSQKITESVKQNDQKSPRLFFQSFDFRCGPRNPHYNAQCETQVEFKKPTKCNDLRKQDFCSQIKSLPGTQYIEIQQKENKFASSLIENPKSPKYCKNNLDLKSQINELPGSTTPRVTLNLSKDHQVSNCRKKQHSLQSEIVHKAFKMDDLQDTSKLKLTKQQKRSVSHEKDAFNSSCCVSSRQDGFENPTVVSNMVKKKCRQDQHQFNNQCKQNSRSDGFELNHGVSTMIKKQTSSEKNQFTNKYAINKQDEKNINVVSSYRKRMNNSEGQRNIFVNQFSIFSNE